MRKLAVCTADYRKQNCVLRNVATMLTKWQNIYASWLIVSTKKRKQKLLKFEMVGLTLTIQMLNIIEGEHLGLSFQPKLKK